MPEVTQLLNAIGQGDPRASAELLPLVYQELRKLAAQKLAQEKPGQTLQATALVHEAYLRLVGPAGADQSWNGRGHFFSAAAEAMRRILIDHARRKQAVKHGGQHHRLELDENSLPIVAPCENVNDLLALDEALDRLAKIDAGTADLVKLLFFAGLNLDEAAVVQGISRSAAYRNWLFARAWLFDALGGSELPLGDS